MFDIICGQTDRHRKNYMAQVVERGDTYEITEICGIDNDLSFGTRDYNAFVGRNDPGKSAVISIEDREGRFVLPAMSQGLADRILSIVPETLHFLLDDLLGREEITCLELRIRGVQDAIKKQKELGSNASVFLSSDREWSELQDRIRFKRSFLSFADIERMIYHKK